jgi:hypothetical protein
MNPVLDGVGRCWGPLSQHVSVLIYKGKLAVVGMLEDFRTWTGYGDRYKTSRACVRWAFFIIYISNISNKGIYRIGIDGNLRHLRCWTLG